MLVALSSLPKLRKLSSTIIKKINKFAGDVRGAREIRNRIIHDQWLRDRANPGQMGHLRITAAKKLEFKIKPVLFPDLAHDLETLEGLQTRFNAIRKEIEVALPTLPEIPQSDLYPIIETPQ